MRFFPDASRLRQRIVLGALLLCGVGGICFHAGGELPAWMQDVVSASGVESALYRLMDLPGIRVLYPRPPAESRNELWTLLTKTPADAELYALRAHADEQALDFSAAAADWKLYVEHAQDSAAANLLLADYYHRRLQSQDEVKTMLVVAGMPSPASQKFTPVPQQRSWQAFARAVKVTDAQALPLETKLAVYRAWMARYPGEPSIYARVTELLIEQREFDGATRTIADYRRAFPQEAVFPVKAAALIAYRQGSPEHALAVYNTGFQPLWPEELVQSYYGMLDATHGQHRMLAEARARLMQNPDDLISVVRIYDYYQQQGRPDAARNTIDEYRFHKDQRKATWTAEELYTFATLLDRANDADEAARYYFALYSASGDISMGQPLQQVALSGMVHLLLSAPDQAIHLGSGNLSIYRDIATLDNGPGYLNGILSLWLNSESPQQEFSEEEKRGLPYFHRAKAAELLGLLDQKFPSAPMRAELHAQMIHAYADYGDSAAVLHAGDDFLKQFPASSSRIPVAMMMADAYARTNDSAAEFAIYDRILGELAAKSDGMPLTASAASAVPPELQDPAHAEGTPATDNSAVAEDTGSDAGAAQAMAETAAGKRALESAMQLTTTTPAAVTAPDDLSYAQVLDRYIGRLTMMKKLPEALAVLRHELDHNPSDPLLYERLAGFLQQNDFSAQEEEVYRRAIVRFQSAAWYDGLARFYIRHQRKQDYARVTRQVVDTFRGTELEAYFHQANNGWPQVSLELNLFAHQRFPHDLVFTRNLLTAYQAKATANPAAWESLLREHWFESDELRSEFFNDLSSTGKLNDEIAKLERLAPADAPTKQSPAAARELADAYMWQSHFEASAPLLGALATAYPANVEIGTDASSVYRSLAYFDPSQTARAVAIEKNLLAADPANLDRLARIGDIYADAAANDATQLAAAKPFWECMPSIHPGSPDGYLQAATIFWDYFQFDGALAEIAAARKQFHDSALYGYEAGAIYENKHDTQKAVAEYVASAVAGNSTSQARLTEISGRPEDSQFVDAATAGAVGEHPTLAALSLRAAVLQASQRGPEIAVLVNRAIDHAASFDEVETLASFAEQQHLPASHQRALQREVALASDPLQRIEIQYALVHALTSQNEVAPAQQIIETVYKQNPKIIGVVRNTTDFYWNNKQQKSAVATLVQASRDAYPELSRAYTLEAAEKSNASGGFVEARQLVTPLLDTDPYGPSSARCLAILADSYARANDDAGLRDFYTTRLATLKSAQLSSAARRDQAALLRRGLILALTRLKDYPGAVDQYILLLRAFPEDADLIQEAALYALRYGRQQQLVAFLQKTVADAPRDSRFAIALGHVDTLFEDYPGAIDAYGKAIAIRKDRSDVYIARADLEERLRRSDDACADYKRLYFLSYKDPQWMVKTAQERARQGKKAEAVQALQTAWIDGRPADAQNDFKVADQLEKWNLLEEARTFAEQGVQRMGENLLTTSEGHDGVGIYVRILTRQHHAEAALKTLQVDLRAVDVSPSSPRIALQQVSREGAGAITDEDWRRNRVAERKQQAQQSYQSGLRQMGIVVATYFTPEEKLAYAQLLDTQRAAATPQVVVSTWIPAAAAAVLSDREALWRKQILLSRTKLASGQLSSFNALEKQRMDNVERGSVLEQYAAARPARERGGILALAEDAWHDDANSVAEIRTLRNMNLQAGEQDNLRERYFQLLLRAAPQGLVQQAASPSATYADAATNYALEKGDKSLALAAIAARSESLKPVWRQAAIALAGLYFADSAPKIDYAFRRALNDATIAERISAPADPTRQITGKIWFYYGMRYGVYRTVVKWGDAEDYMASGLEDEPGNSSSYVGLAQAYADAHDTTAALREYKHALELSPDEASIDRAMAVLLWSDGRKDEAVGEWIQALAILRKFLDGQATPGDFWSDFGTIAADVHEHRLGQQLHPQMDVVLRAYFAKYGESNSSQLMHSAFIASDSPTQAVDWILSLANASGDPGAVLRQIDSAPWLPEEQRSRVLRRELELLQASNKQPEDGAEPKVEQVKKLQVRLLRHLLEEKKDDEAQRLYDSIPSQQRSEEDLQTLRVVLAAHRDMVAPLLADFTANPDTAAPVEAIAKAASRLRNDGDLSSNRRLLKYVFQVKTAQHMLTTSDFLALAQARLDSKDTANAVELLHRMTLVADEPYNGLELAAKLLEDSGHPAEAIPFLSTLAGQHALESQLPITAGAGPSPGTHGYGSCVRRPVNNRMQRQRTVCSPRASGAGVEGQQQSAGHL